MTQIRPSGVVQMKLRVLVNSCRLFLVMCMSPCVPVLQSQIFLVKKVQMWIGQSVSVEGVARWLLVGWPIFFVVYTMFESLLSESVLGVHLCYEWWPLNVLPMATFVPELGPRRVTLVLRPILASALGVPVLLPGGRALLYVVSSKVV